MAVFRHESPEPVDRIRIVSGPFKAAASRAISIASDSVTRLLLTASLSNFSRSRSLLLPSRFYQRRLGRAVWQVPVGTRPVEACAALRAIHSDYRETLGELFLGPADLAQDFMVLIKFL